MAIPAVPDNFSAKLIWFRDNANDFGAAADHTETYHSVLSVRALLDSALAVGTYLFAADGGVPIASAADVGVRSPVVFHKVGADWATQTKGGRLLLRNVIGVNGTAGTGCNVRVGLAPLTVGGAAGLLQYTIGAAVGNSNLGVQNSPPANTLSLFAGAEFSFPVDGAYAPFISIEGGAVPANCVMSLHTQLTQRQID